MINHNFLKNKFSNKEKCLGTWCTIASPTITDIISNSGFDFLILDREHGPINYESLQNQVSICESRSVSPIIRVPDISQSEILRSLDIGAHGIQVPNVNSLDDIKKIIEYSKFPPSGNRGFSTFTRAGGYDADNKNNHYSKTNSNTLVGINLESLKSLDLLEKFVEFDEIDMYFFGTFDLSREVGKPGDVTNPELVNLIKKSNDFLMSKNKITGTISVSPENLSYHLSQGFMYNLYKVDCGIISESFKTIKYQFDSNK